MKEKEQAKAAAEEDDEDEIKTVEDEEGAESERESPMSSDSEQDITTQMISCALNVSPSLKYSILYFFLAKYWVFVIRMIIALILISQEI